VSKLPQSQKIHIPPCPSYGIFFRDSCEANISDARLGQLTFEPEVWHIAGAILPTPKLKTDNAVDGVASQQVQTY